jgi:hypothetical protein
MAYTSPVLALASLSLEGPKLIPSQRHPPQREKYDRSRLRKTPATLFRALVYRVPRDTHLESVQHRYFATTLRELQLWRDYPQHERNESCFTEKGALLRQTLNVLTSSLTWHAPEQRSQEKAIGLFTYLNLSIDCGSKPRSFHARSLRGSRQLPNYFSLFLSEKKWR